MSHAIPVHGTCDARFAEVRNVFQRNFAAGLEIGAAICIMIDGQPVVDLWGGHCDEARTREWQRDTLVNVYSVTKGMAALCAAQLMDRGQLDPDARVAKYWPEFAAAGKEDVTVRVLLS